MKLKKANLQQANSAMGNALQHEAAMRVEARYLAEEKKRRHALFVRRAREVFIPLSFLLVIASGFYAWHTGMFDAVRPALGLGKSSGTNDQEASQKSDARSPSPVQNAAEVVKNVEKHIDAFNEEMARFEGVTIAYWKDVIPEDKPSSTRPYLDYKALVPDTKGGRVFMDIRLAADNSMNIQKLTYVHGLVKMTRAEFDKMIENTPFLVMREGRAYYCSAKKPVRRKGFPVPMKGKSFNPSREEFGALYDQVFKAKLAPPSFSYDVFLTHAPSKRRIQVATVGFGEEVTYERFEAAARTITSRNESVTTILKSGSIEFSHTQKR